MTTTWTWTVSGDDCFDVKEAFVGKACVECPFRLVDRFCAMLEATHVVRKRTISFWRLNQNGFRVHLH